MAAKRKKSTAKKPAKETTPSEPELDKATAPDPDPEPQAESKGGRRAYHGATGETVVITGTPEPADMVDVPGAGSVRAGDLVWEGTDEPIVAGA